MAKSTGPILAIGAITMANQTILNGKPIDWRVPIATGIAAISLSLIERASERAATGIAWLALLTVLFARTDPRVPAPTESLLKWWNE